MKNLLFTLVLFLFFPSFYGTGEATVKFTLKAKADDVSAWVKDNSKPIRIKSGVNIISQNGKEWRVSEFGVGEWTEKEVCGDRLFTSKLIQVHSGNITDKEGSITLIEGNGTCTVIIHSTASVNNVLAFLISMRLERGAKDIEALFKNNFKH